MEEFRFLDNMLEATETGSIVFDKKFKEANAKLEIQLLNDEIRHIIPKLEQEASTNEANTKRLTRQLADANEELNMFPSQFLLDSEEAQIKIDNLRRQKAELEGTQLASLLVPFMSICSSHCMSCALYRSYSKC